MDFASRFFSLFFFFFPPSPPLLVDRAPRLTIAARHSLPFFLLFFFFFSFFFLYFSFLFSFLFSFSPDATRSRPIRICHSRDCNIYIYNRKVEERERGEKGGEIERRCFRQIRCIYLFVTGVICTRRGATKGGRFGKIHLTGGHKEFIVIVGGRLSEAGTGRQLLARAKDEPFLSVFVLSTNIASNVRTRYPFFEPEEKGQDLFPTLTPGPLPPPPPHTSPRSTMNRRVESPWTRAPPNFIYVFLPRDGDALKAKRGRFSIPRDRVSCNESPRGVVENIDRDDDGRQDLVSWTFTGKEAKGRGKFCNEKFCTEQSPGGSPVFGKKGGGGGGGSFARLSTGERSYHVQPRRHVVRMCSACVLYSPVKRKGKRKRKKDGRSPNRVIKIESGNKWSRGPLPLFDSPESGFVEFLEPMKLSGSSTTIEKKKKKRKKEDNGKTNSPPKFAQSLGQLRVVKLRILIGEYSPRGLSPHHKRVHRSLHVGCSFVTGTPATFVQ